MNATLQAAIDAGLADITRAMDAPGAPFVYGADVSCAADLDPMMTELPGDDITVLGQALIRRLDCPRGALRDDLDYGTDVRGMLNRGTSTTERNAIAGRIRAELTKDDRVDDAVATVNPSATGDALSISIRVTVADPDKTAFTMTLAVTSAAVLLKEISQ